MITLLNGERWREADILEKMKDDSFYYGHLGQHALSSSAIKKLLDGPKAYKTSLSASDDSQPLRDGQLVHMHILEPHKVKDLIVIEGTKAKKEFKEAVAEHGSHKVFTQSEVDNAYWIAEALHNNAEASFLIDDCEYEIPGVAMIDGIPFRAKADVISKDKKSIIDIKTTSSIGEDANDFYWSARKFKYAMQAVLYMRIFGAEEFTFLVIDKTTKEIAICPCSDEFLMMGEDMLLRGIENYKKFFTSPDSETLINNNVIRRIL